MFGFGRKLLLSVLLVFVVAVPGAAAAQESPGQIACNGSSLLCERKLNEVVLPGSHNSMSAEELGWFNPNHTHAIPGQLSRGARGMLIDTFYGNPMNNGQVSNVSKSVGRVSGAPTYLCHASCLFGASPLAAELGKIADFLKSNPHEVMVFVNEDNIAPEDFATAVQESGLDEYLYRGPAGPWPTLGSMIASGQRVVMLAQSEVGDVPWYHLAYQGPMRETPYSFVGTDKLTDSGQLEQSCAPLRGEGSATADSLFLMNHWATTTVPDSFEPLIGDAEVVNTKAAIVARAEACEQRRGFLPTILAVDFFGTGDVVGAARQLNGVASEAVLRADRVRPARTRAGGRAVMSVTIRNTGDAPARSVNVCAKAPSRLAKRAPCTKLGELKAGAVRIAKVRISTRKGVRGRGNVEITVGSSTGTIRLRSDLTVSPGQSLR